MIKHLLTGAEFQGVELEKLFSLAAKIKRERGTAAAIKPLAGMSVGTIFAKASTRTRVSFEVGISELGGHAVYLDESRTQMGRGEPIKDTARVLGRYLHGIVIRTFRQSDVEELAEFSGLPVINALTDDYHPTQALADLFTMYEKKGTFKNVKLAFIGDGASNMSNSLMMVSKIAGVHYAVGAPAEFRPAQALMDQKLGPGTVEWTEDPFEAAKDADFIYTDVWVSMGFEKEKEERFRILGNYKVTMELLAKAKKDVKILHCLPAHRGEEITDEVIESDNSIVFDEAENRLHVQKAIMARLIGGC